MNQENKKVQNLLLRYYKGEEITLDCEVITPMFLGNADQQAEWRAAPFKAMLRYWWRVTKSDQHDLNLLRQEEGKIFGAAGEIEKDNVGKSLLAINVSSNSSSLKNSFPQTEKIRHTECERQKFFIDPLIYLAGMGLIERGEIKHPYFPPQAPFTLFLSFPHQILEELQFVLSLVKAFGTIGARCRNGWGSFHITDDEISPPEAVKKLELCTKNWKIGFNKDFPNCLGIDDQGRLLWKTDTYPSWQNVMKQLAEVYVKVRAENLGPGLEKLDPGEKQNPAKGNEPKPGERHLLGIPLTKHPGPWGGGARHASPLRFIVKRKPEGHIGFILHLPHRHSDKMKFPGVIQERGGQIKTWEKVHRKLDNLLQRARYEDCL